MKERGVDGVGVFVILKRGGTVLLGQRHHDPAKAGSQLHGEGTWTVPGGSMRFGQIFEDECAREVQEETGIVIDNSGLKLISVSNDMVPDAHFVTIGFVCEKFQGEPLVLEPDEITEWRWFPLTGLPKPLFFPTERGIRNYLNHTVYQS